MQNIFLLSVVIQHAGEQRLSFDTKRKATAALRALEVKMGLKFENDPDRLRHTIKSSDGEMTVCVREVVAARVIDVAEFLRLTESDRKSMVEQTARINSTVAAALAAAMKSLAPAA